MLHNDIFRCASEFTHGTCTRSACRRENSSPSFVDNPSHSLTISSLLFSLFILCIPVWWGFLYISLLSCSLLKTPMSSLLHSIKLISASSGSPLLCLLCALSLSALLWLLVWVQIPPSVTSNTLSPPSPPPAPWDPWPPLTAAGPAWALPCFPAPQFQRRPATSLVDSVKKYGLQPWLSPWCRQGLFISITCASRFPQCPFPKPPSFCLSLSLSTGKPDDFSSEEGRLEWAPCHCPG